MSKLTLTTRQLVIYGKEMLISPLCCMGMRQVCDMAWIRQLQRDFQVIPAIWSFPFWDLSFREQHHPGLNQHRDLTRVNWVDVCVLGRHVEQMIRSFCDVDCWEKILIRFRDRSQRKFVVVLILEGNKEKRFDSNWKNGFEHPINCIWICVHQQTYLLTRII